MGQQFTIPVILQTLNFSYRIIIVNEYGGEEGEKSYFDNFSFTGVAPELPPLYLPSSFGDQLWSPIFPIDGQFNEIATPA